MPRHSKTKGKKPVRKSTSTPKKSRSKVQVEQPIVKNEEKEDKEKRDRNKIPTASEFCKELKNFTRYVMTSSGIKASIVRAIVCLYEETHKLDDAISYITSLLGGDLPSENHVAEMQGKIQELRDKIEKLEDTNSQLLNKLEGLEEKARINLLSCEIAGEYEGEGEQEEYPLSNHPGGSVDLKSCIPSVFSW